LGRCNQSKGTSMTDKEALKLALGALEYHASQTRPIYQTDIAITALKEALAQPEQEPVAYLVLFEGAGKLLEFTKGNYLHGAKVEHIPLYVKPQIEVGCAECGVSGGHALYCVACTEKFDVVISKAVEHEREKCAGIDIPVTVPNRDYSDMSPLEIYEEALMDATLSFRAAIRARGQA